MPPKEIEFECVSITNIKGSTTYSFRSKEGDSINFLNIPDSPSPVVQPGEKYTVTFKPIKD